MTPYEILLTLILVSLFNAPILILGNNYVHDNSYAIPVILDLGASNISLNATNILVTIVDGDDEIEVPFTTYPMKIEKLQYIYNYKYNGKDTSMMTYYDFKDIQEKIASGDNPSSIVTVSGSRQSIVLSGALSNRIIVFIPRNTASNRDYNSWYPKALLEGLDSRLKYYYNGLTIYVYFSCRGGGGRSPLFLNFYHPNTRIILTDFTYHNDRLDKTYEYRINMSVNELVNAGEASFVEEEKSLDIISSTPNLIGLWYYLPWSSEKSLGRSYMLNITLSGDNYYHLEDEFRVLENTTHLEIWIWIEADQNVRFNLEAYIGNDEKVFDERLGLEPDLLQGLGIMIEGEKYIEPGNVPFKIIFRDVTDTGSHISVRSVVIARSEVVFPRVSDYYVQRYHISGGELFSDNTLNGDIKTRDEFMFPENGKIAAHIELPFNVYEHYCSDPFRYYPRIQIYIESSEKQLYDRYVDVYINGLQVAHVRSQSEAPNGSPGKRTVEINASTSILEAIINAMRMRQPLQVIVEIENYSSSIDTRWYIKNITIEILSRPTWTTSKITDLDPVSPRRAGRIRSSILLEHYTAMKLYRTDNDSYTAVNQHMVRLSHHGFDVGDYDLLSIQLDYRYNGNPIIRDGHWIIYQGVNRIEFVVDIYARTRDPINYSLDYAGIYSSNARISPEWLGTAQNILMTLGIVSAFISLGSSPWITLVARTPSAILSYPGYIVYGDSFSSVTCRYISDERGETHIRCSVTYSPSFNDTSFQLRLILSKPGYPWRIGDVVRVSYTVKTYTTYEAYGDGVYLVRRSYVYENNTAYLEPY